MILLEFNAKATTRLGIGIDTRRPGAVLMPAPGPSSTLGARRRGGGYQPIAMFDSMTLRAPSRSEPVCCM